MDTRAESLTGVGGWSAPEPDLPQQLLDFRAHLREAVDELHTRRDAEARFEEQLGALASEKRQLERAKERLQHQSEDAAKRHAETVASVEKRFQAKIKSIEEEKGKHEASVEIKDKEINSLKAELKSAQLLKVNLEEKISGLEQTLLLQRRSEGDRLAKLGEAQKHFSVLSRQCAAIKEAHQILEQSVGEATRRNVQLTSANAKQEQIITSLRKEAEMMKTFIEENAAVRREKLEVVRALQHAQQLLLSQTRAVSRAEAELQTEAAQHQALKQEHEVMREKNKAMEDKLARLTEERAARQRAWDKEKRGGSQSWPALTRLPPGDGPEGIRAATKAAGGQNTWNHRQQRQNTLEAPFSTEAARAREPVGAREDEGRRDVEGEEDRQRSGELPEDTERGCDGGVGGVAQTAGGANGSQDHQEMEGEEGVTHSRNPNRDAEKSDTRQVIDSTEPLQAARLLLHPPPAWESSPEGGGPSGL